VKKRRNWSRWLPAAILSALLLLSVSCTTCPPTVEVPLDWPDFPDPTGEVELVDGVVTMSLDYWLEVAAYVVKVDRVRAVVGETLER